MNNIFYNFDEELTSSLLSNQYNIGFKNAQIELDEIFETLDDDRYLKTKAYTKNIGYVKKQN